jgi:peptide/nickel transport system ATP-binding protein
MTDTPLIQARGLHLTLPGADGRPLPVLRGVDLTLPRGGTLGLIGESGCGKSLTALALMNLLPEGAVRSGSLQFEGRELTDLPEREWCRLRGARIAMVFQEPMTALNPVHTVGAQVAEPLRLHHGLSAASAAAEALRLLERVRLPQARQRLHAWPHQLSGGQRQRVGLAIALAARPALLIADEPTTALDASLQREVLTLIAELVREDGMALLLISHDLALVAEAVQALAVMYAGRVVEHGPTGDVFARLAHPYTRGLHGARPRLGLRRMLEAAGQVPRLATIPGRVPAPHEDLPGCAFQPRCTRAADGCAAGVPPLHPLPGGTDHAVACLHPWS